MSEAAYDRSAEDLGNIVELGHVNFRVPDQAMATTFYVSGLGLTRDPYMMTGISNMWVNVGNSQFHLPTGQAVVAPGIVTGLVVPDLGHLVARLERIRKDLSGTAFSFTEGPDGVEVTCPWGNRINCHAPDAARFGAVRLGMAYVDFEVARGSAEPIARFYAQVVGARTSIEQADEGQLARITCGPGQALRFRERHTPAPPCPEHHIQIYLADFSGPYHRLAAMGLPLRDSSRHQYSFADLHDPARGQTVFSLDHETRSMTHPMYGRQLVNRNAMQGTGGYRAGQDELTWRL